ncbi:MAG: transposase, partial [Chloroflexota bacterium]
MNFNPQKHHRRSIRLQNYDYTQAGAYFITICTYNREFLFGDVVNGEMMLNDYGRIVEEYWNETPTHFPNVETDAFVVMPNHIHGIIVIAKSVKAQSAGTHIGPHVGAQHAAPLRAPLR